ncbi:MAG TPA: hypothetical protein VI488_09545 [Candidatus Angelobacter sp.]
MFKFSVITTVFLAACAHGQQEPQQPSSPQPQVRLNYLNVCTPSAEEQAQIKSAFVKAQAKPAFSRDFEVSRGRATLKDAPDSRFVRYRRDMAPESALLAAQYSMSTDEDSTVETLVLRTRDPKEFHELSFEDRVSAGAASPLSLLAVDTPVSRIRLERLGKNSIVLARCEGGDQSAYEPLFRQASEIMAQYRKALELGSTLRSDIIWLAGSAKPAVTDRQANKTPK